MAADGPGILQHDLAMDVVDAFFERFNKNDPAQSIAAALIEELGYPMLDVVEKEVFCTALIECLWQLGAPFAEYEQLLGSLNDPSAMQAYWGDTLSKRILAVKRLLTKVRTPKPKPRKPKRIPKNRATAFRQGDYVLYGRSNGRFVPMIFWQSENCFGIEYYFALPNLSRVTDDLLIDRFLRPGTSVTERELATFFTDKRRFRIASIKEKLVKSNQQQFTRFKNNAFPPSGWEPYGGGSLAAGTIEEFERLLNGNGSRSLTDEELKTAMCEQNVGPTPPSVRFEL